jgi:ParB family transcriptional regulator, chromosome partitioning protein
VKKALGRGLSALIPDSYAAELKEKAAASASSASAPASTPQKPAGESQSAFRLIPVTQIIPNQDQPRKEFSPEAIQELANSIKEKGILQPVVVKRIKDDQFMLICGERRFRASQLCGLTEVPAIIKDVASDELLEWALIENIQRQDLNALEEAEAYSRLAEERMLSQDEIAKRVGKERSTVANCLRLLRLPDEVKLHIIEGRISAGHARAILGLLTPEHQRQMTRRIIEENLSVRQVEAIVNRSNAQKRKAKHARNLKPEIVDLEHKLAQHLGTQIKIFPNKNQKEGRLEIRYFSLDDLDRILQILGIKAN